MMREARSEEKKIYICAWVVAHPYCCHYGNCFASIQDRTTWKLSSWLFSNRARQHCVLGERVFEPMIFHARSILCKSSSDSYMYGELNYGETSRLLGNARDVFWVKSTRKKGIGDRHDWNQPLMIHYCEYTEQWIYNGHSWARIL